MIKNGLDRAVISVRDMNESLAFFRDLIGMNVVEDTYLSSDQLGMIWTLPEGTKGRTVFLRKEDQTAMIQLIEFQPNSGLFIRENCNPYDYCIFDIAFRVKDLDASYAKLKDLGYDAISAPVVYTADWVNVTVKEVIMIGPNKMPIALIERLSEPIPEITGEYGALVDVAQFVENMDQTTSFYVDVLGLSKVFDQVLPDGLIEEVAGLPEGTEARMAFTIKPGIDAPLLEFIECKTPSNRLTHLAVPPNLGIFALGFETDDLNLLNTKINDAGYKVLSGPVKVNYGKLETVYLLTIEGPNQSILQFYQII